MSGACPRPAFMAVLFDLDGTLVDSRPGIVASARAALADVAPEVELPSLDGMLGRPLDELIGTIAPSLPGTARAALATAFRRHYDEEGWRASEAYPGVEETIMRLACSGVRLFLITNKRRTPSQAIVAARGFEDAFEGIYTPDSRVPTYASKGEMGLACMREQALAPEATLVVGDSYEDLDMARECDVSFAAAAWGYGDAAGHLAAGDRGLLYHSTTGRQERVLGAMADLLALVMPGESSEAVHES